MNRGNRIFDALARPRLFFARRSLSAFHICGYTGVMAALALGMTLAAQTGLEYWVLGLIAGTVMATFLVVALATKIITGQEQLIYYHQEIAVMVMSAVVARLLHRPVLPYMDLTILSVGLFLACGRIGCMMVGCCHGRPCAFGVRYREEHAKEGFTTWLVGVRLFPIQIVESLWVFGVVICGSVMVLRHSAPGSALAFYTVTYGAARFIFEFVRGDTDRPYTWGFSQGQWLSLWLISIVIVAELQNHLAVAAWHNAVWASMIALMLSAAVRRKLDRTQKFLLLHPHHVSEVAEALRLAATADENGVRRLTVASTSLGVQISAGSIHDHEIAISHYTFSRRDGLNRESAAVLAKLIMQLRHTTGSTELLTGQGAFHLLVRPPEKELALQ